MAKYVDDAGLQHYLEKSVEVFTNVYEVTQIDEVPSSLLAVIKRGDVVYDETDYAYICFKKVVHEGPSVSNPEKCVYFVNVGKTILDSYYYDYNYTSNEWVVTHTLLNMNAKLDKAIVGFLDVASIPHTLTSDELTAIKANNEFKEYIVLKVTTTNGTSTYYKTGETSTYVYFSNLSLSEKTDSENADAKYLELRGISLNKSNNQLTSSVQVFDSYYPASIIDSMIAGIPTTTYEIVQTLPPASASNYFNIHKVVYLVPDNTSSDDAYDEYICLRNGSESNYTYYWEHIGNTTTNMEPLTDPEIDSIFNSVFNNA